MLVYRLKGTVNRNYVHLVCTFSSVYALLTAAFLKTIHLCFLVVTLHKQHILKLYQSYFLIQETYYTVNKRERHAVITSTSPQQHVHCP